MQSKELKETWHVLGVAWPVPHLLDNELLELGHRELLGGRVESRFIEVDTVVDNVIEKLICYEGQPLLRHLLSLVLEQLHQLRFLYVLLPLRKLAEAGLYLHGRELALKLDASEVQELQEVTEVNCLFLREKGVCDPHVVVSDLLLDRSDDLSSGVCDLELAKKHAEVDSLGLRVPEC